jgi:hypothetical protein
MLAMFGWNDPKMAAHDIAPANREKLGIAGMDTIVAFDATGSRDNLMPPRETNRMGTPSNPRAISAKNAVISMLIVGLWCARRAVAFTAISMGYRDPLRHKVHFGRKSAFEEMELGHLRSWEAARGLPGLHRVSDLSWLIPTSPRNPRSYPRSKTADELLRSIRWGFQSLPCPSLDTSDRPVSPSD